MIGAGVERATFVVAGHTLDKGAQAGAVIEHEGVDGDSLTRDRSTSLSVSCAARC